MSVLTLGRREDSIAPPATWAELANRVRRFRPDVVVQVARKMPRLAEYFGLNFGERCLIVSDLAIPYIHRLLRGARVAIVDDVINVGSTLKHARVAVEAAKPAAVKSFALGRKKVAVPGNDDAECVLEGVLAEGQYKRLTRFVPSVLAHLPKPYDLEFPIIPCRINVPFQGLDEVADWLITTFGPANVNHWAADTKGGSERFTVAVNTGRPGLWKLRLYFYDDMSGCNLVPIAIPPALNSLAVSEVSSPLAAALLQEVDRSLVDMPPACALWPNEPSLRAKLFAVSLDFGLRYINLFRDLLGIEQPGVMSTLDLQLLFGPINLPPRSCEVTSHVSCNDAVGAPGQHESPFGRFLLDSPQGAGFLENVRKRSSARRGYHVFLAIFAELASAVGASDPSTFSLDWPVSRGEIERNPYLRLRIGPTFEDIVTLYQILTRESDESRPKLRLEISCYLDHSIDSGAVVPTLAFYNGDCYRVYRKGERDGRDEAVDRVQYAWHASQTPMSLTRVSKINTILAFSDEVASILIPQTIERGNAAMLPQSVLDLEGAEIAALLRNSGLLRESEHSKE